MPHLQHPGEHTLRALPLRIAAQRGYQRGARHHVGLDAALQHLVEQLHRARPHAARRACADRRRVRMPCARQAAALSKLSNTFKPWLATWAA